VYEADHSFRCHISRRLYFHNLFIYSHHFMSMKFNIACTDIFRFILN